MNSAALQIEAAQLGLVQRTQKYLDAAALTLIEGVSSTLQLQSGEPNLRFPPLQPVSAAPRDGGSMHVIA